MRPENVTVAIIPVGEGVKVWSASFYLRTPFRPGDTPQETERRRREIEQRIARAIEGIDL